jgi:hypothetical protein
MARDLAPQFDGADYQPDRDHSRLTGQIASIFAVIADRQWRTLDQLVEATGAPHASVSAQLRNLRKPRFGKHTIERRHIANGLYEYRLAPTVADPVPVGQGGPSDHRTYRDGDTTPRRDFLLPAVVDAPPSLPGVSASAPTPPSPEFRMGTVGSPLSIWREE